MRRGLLFAAALLAGNAAWAAAQKHATPAPAASASPGATPLASSTSGEAAPAPHAAPPPVKIPGPSGDGSAPLSLRFVPPEIDNGGVTLATVGGLIAGDVVTGSFAGDLLPLTAVEGSASFLVPADFKVTPGKYPVVVRVHRKGKTLLEKASLKVNAGKYKASRVTLPKKLAEFDDATVARINKDAHELSVIWPRWTPVRQWSGPFIKPLPGIFIDFFGPRFINGQERSPHSGVDQRGKEGDPIRAINAGTVAYVGDQFLTGNNTIVDHGQGVYSMYFHQSKVLVKLGQKVAKGEIIGEVGATGRVTGPHLHWGVRVAGARVDPLHLLDLALPETPGAPPMVVGSADLPAEELPPALAGSSGTATVASPVSSP